MAAYDWAQTQSFDNFKGVFAITQLQNGRVLLQAHSRVRNLDSPKHSEDQDAVKTITFFERIGTKKPKVVLSGNKVKASQRFSMMDVE